MIIDCKPDHSTCKNQKLQKKENKKLGVGDSSIVGWGLYAMEDLKKDDLIGEYIGEIVDLDDLNERSEYMDLENSTYMFTLNDEYTVDSRTMGNLLRFANHSKSKANAYTKIVFANGNHRICLFASENIKKYDEIFFDYDGQNILCDRYDWINDEKKVPKQGVHQKNIKANKNAGNYMETKGKKKTHSPVSDFLNEYKKGAEAKKYSMITGHKRKRSKTSNEYIPKSIPLYEQTNDVKKIVMDFKMKLKKDKVCKDENEEKRDSNISVSEVASTKTNSKDLEGSKELLKKVFTNFRLKNGIE